MTSVKVAAGHAAASGGSATTGDANLRALAASVPDDNGNLTAGGGDSFAWDVEDRMTSATVGGTATTFAYRGDGLRASRTTGGVTTNFTWDVNAGLPVVLDDGNQYVYGAGLLSQKQGGSWVGILLPRRRPGEHNGHRGRVRGRAEQLHLRRLRQAVEDGQPRERVRLRGPADRRDGAAVPTGE